MDFQIECHIKSLECNFDYKIKKSLLFVESKYFQKIILKNPEQSEFILPQHLQCDKTIFTLFFSEIEKNMSENGTSQINSTLSSSILQQLFELSQFFETSGLEKKILNVMNKNLNIDYYIIDCNNKKGDKQTKEEENVVLQKISEDNIKLFLNSNLSIERKIRILSKINPISKIYSFLQDYLFMNNKIYLI